MIDVTILWDDGSAFLVAFSEEDYGPAEAVDEVFDMISRGAVLLGRWVSGDGVPQEQFRFAKFHERGIRCVMTDRD